MCIRDRGGGVYLTAADNLRVENARFSLNSAQTNGGAMALVSVGTAEADGEYAQIQNSSFGENEAGNTGGAVYIAGGFVEFNTSNFEGNTAGRPRRWQALYTRYYRFICSAPPLPESSTCLLWQLSRQGLALFSHYQPFFPNAHPLDESYRVSQSPASS